MKGWKMFLWGLALATAPGAFDYFAGVDWTDYVSPTWAPFIAGAVTIALRAVTTTTIFKRS